MNATHTGDLSYGVVREKVTLDITGMTCAACSTRIDKRLNKIPGVLGVTVNLTTEKAVVEFAGTSPAELIKAVEQIGYGAKVHVEGGATRRQPAAGRRCTFLFKPWFQLALATLVQVVVGYRFYRSAWLNLTHGRANMDVLAALGQHDHPDADPAGQDAGGGSQGPHLRGDQEAPQPAGQDRPGHPERRRAGYPRHRRAGR